jgi:hypothetical protein
MTASGERLSRSAHAIQAFHRPPYWGVFVTGRNGDFGPLRRVIGKIISIISGPRRALAAN